MKEVIEYRHFCDCVIYTDGIRVGEANLGTCKEKNARDEKRTVTYSEWESVQA